VSDDDLKALNSPKRANRFGLYGPFGLLLAAFAVWSGYWFYTARQIETTLRTREAALLQEGYRVSSDPYSVEGYPYRLLINFAHLSVIAPSGRGFSTPNLRVEANAYALDRWTMEAADGLTFYRGHNATMDLGQVTISASDLRASLSGINKPIYRIDISGTDLALTSSNLNHPFPFSSAKSIEAHLRPTSDVADSADLMLNLAGARGPANSFFGKLSGDKTNALQVEGTLSQASAFSDGNLAKDVDTWKAQGGQMSRFRAKLVQGTLSEPLAKVFSEDCRSNAASASQLNMCAEGDALTLDDRKRLNGRLKIQISGTFDPIDALAATGLISQDNMTLAKPLLDMTLALSKTEAFDIDFKNGGSYIGPLKVSDAPTVP